MDTRDLHYYRWQGVITKQNRGRREEGLSPATQVVAVALQKLFTLLHFEGPAASHFPDGIN